MSRPILARSPASVLLLAASMSLACGGGSTPADGGGDGGDATVTCEVDTDCSDGLFCTGVEQCDPAAPAADARGCLVGPGDPCSAAGEVCDEVADMCGPSSCSVPDADGDGSDSVACGGDDCDDTDPNRFPSNPEVCDAEDHDEDCDARTFGFRDSDGDGVADALCCNVDDDDVRSCGTDCNDAAPGTNPSVPEACDGLDNDCDGSTDEGVLEEFFPDVDGDSYGDPDGATMSACFRPDGYADRADDCDDTRIDVNPAAPEICDPGAADENCDGAPNPEALCSCTGDETRMCALPGTCAAGTQRCIGGAWGGCSIAPVAEVCNGIDDDCNGMTDEMLTVTCYLDADDDGYSPSASPPVERCPAAGRGAVGGCPFGFTDREPLAADVDCDDDATNSYPGATEVCDGARADESCNGVANEGCDCDGAAMRACPSPGACAAGSQTCSAGAWGACSIAPVAEICNGIDDDCDGMADETLTITCYDDADDDGFALSGAATSVECPATGRGSVGGCPFGLTNRAPATTADQDCNDAFDHIFPGAAELCDMPMVDEDCDSENNEDCMCDGAESRGCPELGVCSSGSQTCAGGTWGACSISPTTDICNSADDDCDGRVDEGETIPCWIDGDGDTYAAASAVFIDACACPAGYTSREPVGADIDCDDMRTSISPAGTETCDGEDEDCDGDADNGLPLVPRYIDGDGDMARGLLTMRCEGDPGSVAVSEDCDETNTAIYVGAPELCDRVDNDCGEGGLVDVAEDMDGDGFTEVGYPDCSGGPLPKTDCDDGDSTSNPGAAEVCDGADNDCNMVVDDGSATASCASPTSYRVCAHSDVVGANACTVVGCMPGFDDCNAITVDDGCETPVLSDRNNCGGCGVLCPAATLCNAGVCEGLVEDIATGGYHACARRDTGRVACWGRNEDGQLGNGTTAAVAGPVEVTGLVDATQVTAGAAHSCALRSGEVVCWGSNANGRLGDGTTVDSSTPVAVLGISDATRVSAGRTHTCAIVAAGAVVCWGDNSSGQLGDGTTMERLTFVSTGITGAGSLSASRHTCAEAGGAVYCWGRGIEGQLGDGTTTASASTPVVVTGIADATSVATGALHSCARRAGGTVECWGRNFFGQLGDASMMQRESPVAVVLPGGGALGGAADLPQGMGSNHSCARLDNGEVRCWGRGAAGQLGIGTTSTYANARTVLDPLKTDGTDALDNVTQLAVGLDFACALHPSRRVTCWGANDFGQLTNGSVAPSLEPSDTRGINLSRDITVGTGHGMVLGVDGHVRGWGLNGQGQLGDGTTSERARPVLVSTLVDGVQLSAGGRHTCVRRSDGSAACWGSNGSGEVGAGPGTFRVPEPVSGLTDAVDVQAGFTHACAVRSTGQVVCWGEGFYRQLGNGGMAQSDVPVDVTGLVDGLRVAPGGRHTCALRRGGQVQCWGEGSAGQLGDGLDTDSAVPVDVTGLPTIVQVTAGYDHSCARGANGDLYCWGDGTSGQLGDGTGISRSTPVSVVDTGGLSSASVVSAFYYHTCAVDSSVGRAYCWGDGGSFQLGTGTGGETAPTAVVGATANVRQVAAGEVSTCGLVGDAPMCWGSNWGHQLGTDTFDDHNEAFPVVDLP